MNPRILEYVTKRSVKLELSKNSKNYFTTIICYAFRVLVTFVQLKKREKYPWRNVTFSKIAD